MRGGSLKMPQQAKEYYATSICASCDVVWAFEVFEHMMSIGLKIFEVAIIQFCHSREFNPF